MMLFTVYTTTIEFLHIMMLFYIIIQVNSDKFPFKYFFLKVKNVFCRKPCLNLHPVKNKTK